MDLLILVFLNQAAIDCFCQLFFDLIYFEALGLYIFSQGCWLGFCFSELVLQCLNLFGACLNIPFVGGDDDLQSIDLLLFALQLVLDVIILLAQGLAVELQRAYPSIPLLEYSVPLFCLLF